MEHPLRETLLLIARSAIEAKLANGAAPDMQCPDVDHPAAGGLFVSLHNGRRLRGCVGRIECNGYRVADLVRCMAIAVLEDPRFAARPVTFDEMSSILIELSLLSQATRTLKP